MATTINQAAATTAQLLAELPFIGSMDFLADADAAEDYVNLRSADAAKFVQSINWKAGPMRMGRETLRAEVYGLNIVQYSSGSGSWGELFKYDEMVTLEHKTIPTFEQFVAYMLARFW